MEVPDGRVCSLSASTPLVATARQHEKAKAARREPLVVCTQIARRTFDMTQEYVIGELSSFIGDLQRISGDRQLRNLRRRAECSSIAVLPLVAVEALDRADFLCWCSLARGEMDSFLRETEVAARLYEFALCAGLMRA